MQNKRSGNYLIQKITTEMLCSRPAFLLRSCALWCICATSRYVSRNACHCTMQLLRSYTFTMKIILLSASTCFISVPSSKHIFILNVLFLFARRGFGFITFADPASVDKVLAQGNHELDGKKVSNFRIPRINSNQIPSYFSINLLSAWYYKTRVHRII